MSFTFPRYSSEEVPEERSGHTAVHYNGNIFVWGGYRDVQSGDNMLLMDRYLPSDVLWVYNIETASWKKVELQQESTNERIPPLSGANACELDSKIYIFGGYSPQGHTADVYCVDLRTMQQTCLTDKIHGFGPSRRDKCCSWIYKHYIVYFGGYGPSPNPKVNDTPRGQFVFNNIDIGFRDSGWNNHIYVFDTDKLEWSQPNIKGVAPTPRAAHASATLGCHGYMFGGRYNEIRTNDLYYLDFDTWTWSPSLISTSPTIPEGRTWHTLSTISDKHLFLYGGFNNRGEALGDAWVLDSETVAWTQLDLPSTNLPHSRMWHTTCSTDMPGEVIIFGGCKNSVMGPDPFPEHSNKITIFRHSPLPLARLCMDSIVNRISVLKLQLNHLPISLSKKLQRRVQIQEEYVNRTPPPSPSKHSFFSFFKHNR